MYELIIIIIVIIVYYSCEYYTSSAAVITSGAQYNGVPQADFNIVSLLNLADIPKSIMTGSVLLFNNIFSNFKSRCTIPALYTYIHI